jgi:WD40 repeat protein
VSEQYNHKYYCFLCSTDAAVLSITSKENFVAAGLYSPKIVAFDPREPKKRLLELLYSHTRSIIDLCLIENYYLISLSEDKTVSVWDLRKNNTVKSMCLSKVKETHIILKILIQ